MTIDLTMVYILPRTKFSNFKRVISMTMTIAAMIPTITQTLAGINNPEPVKQIGSADIEASAGATCSGASTGSVGSSCGNSIDTYA